MSSARHAKPSNRSAAVWGGTVIALAVLLFISVASAVSFARPDHSFAPPTEAKFFSTAVSATERIHPHPILLATDFSGPQSIKVKSGQTLSSIARHVYGKSSLWPVLWWDNRSKVPNPNMLRVGVRLSYGKWHHMRPWLSKRALAAIPKPKPAPVASDPISTTTVAAAPVQSSSATPVQQSSPVQSYSGAPGSFQACVIARESGGNPNAVNPSSGAGGLYQFLPSTWAALGFPGLPENASVAMQNAAFQKAYAESGTSPWAPYDGC